MIKIQKVFLNTKFIFLFFLIYKITSFANINERITNILQKVPDDTRYSILVINPLNNDTIFAYNQYENLIPASNTKLFTTYVALNLLGPNYELSTKILTDDFNLDDGVVNGNIYIKGFGNPVFNDENLLLLINKIKEIGITKITGKIIGDDSFFDSEYSREDWIIDELTKVKLPPVSALVLNRNQKITYKKYRRRTRRYVSYFTNPPLEIAGILRDKLIENNIIVEGDASQGITPNHTKEIAISSIQLKELINLINKRSDNYFAECLFKTIGAVYTGKQGNAFNSAQTINKFLVDNDVFSNGTKIIDGSGLSKYNQVSVASLVSLLENIYLDIKLYNIFYSSLSIAGVDGTLSNRMEGTAAENNFRGKTGTLNNTSSISGYLTTKNGEDFIISMIFQFNRKGGNFYKKIEDEIIALIAEYY